MDKNIKDSLIKNNENELGFSGLVNLFHKTQTAFQNQAAHSVDSTLAVRNWLFGWYIVEFENAGAKRSELYGKQLIKQLADELKSLGIRGVSQTSLKQFRRFYEAYKEIGQAVPDQSKQESVFLEIIETLYSRFTLGWTHYVTLLTVKNSDERNFYELETLENGWGYRKLERQINSGLYERLALSRNKKMSCKCEIF